MFWAKNDVDTRAGPAYFKEAAKTYKIFPSYLFILNTSMLERLYIRDDYENLSDQS